MTPEQLKANAAAQARRKRAEAEAAAAEQQPRDKNPPDQLEDLGYGVAAGLFQGGLDLVGGIVNPASLTQGEEFANTIAGISGRPFYQAETKLGKLGQAGARGAALGAAGGPGATLPRMAGNALRWGVLPSIASEAAGQATEGSKWETPARIAAGLATGVAPTAIKAAVAGGTKPGTNLPNFTQLLKTGGDEYNTLRRLDVRYRPEAIAQRVQDLMFRLERDYGIGPEEAPRTYQLLQRLMAAPPPKPGETVFMPLHRLETHRRRLRWAGKNMEFPGDKVASSVTREMWDDFIEAADPATVLSGPADVAGQLSRNARANYSAGKASKNYNDLAEASENRAGSTYSGQNLENILRRKAEDVVNPLKPKNQEGMTPEEIAMMKGVALAKKPGAIKGVPSLRNALRGTGNALGGGGGFGATFVGSLGGGIGASVLGPAGWVLGLVPPAVGYGLKKAATALTQREFNKVDEARRLRSPLAQHMASQGLIEPPKTLSPVVRASMGQAAVADALGRGMPEEKRPPLDPAVQAIIDALGMTQ